MQQEFKNGLNLIRVDYHEVNQKKESGKGLMGKNIVLKVPKDTKFVHLGVTTVNITFGTDDKPQPAKLGKLAYEITNRDLSGLAQGEFKCEFRALLESDEAHAEFSVYFVLEVLCFG